MKTTTVRDWLAELGDRTPAPGGGAVSALNGAIAAAQLKMVCEYSKDEEIKTEIPFLKQKTEVFLNLAEEDSAAFSKVSEAYKSRDTGKIDSALTGAIQVSIDVIDNCEGLLSFCEAKHQDFNPKLTADVITALANLRAAVSSAQAMEQTNIDAIEVGKPEKSHAGTEVLERIDKLAEKVRAKE
ncbi:MAG TPA: cyclodeaminase/cyclohydrolase family protein [Candidatus Saccharimonadales bacterium]|nr:cyclodeaminase/cyclohydrolase family protein [Candidatus Saccharimonadales bacterium]